MDADLIKAKEVMEAHGFTVVMPGLVARTDPAKLPGGGATIERPATGAAEMEQALASSAPGGDLSMASHAGLALAVGEIRNRMTILEGAVAHIAKALDVVERPEHVEHEPVPTPAVEDAVIVDPEGHGRVERGADGLPNLSTPDPAALCTCGHTRLQHNGHKYACHAKPGSDRPCRCVQFNEATELIS